MATLILCTDNATSRALWAVFVNEENRNACFEVTYEVITRFWNSHELLEPKFWLRNICLFNKNCHRRRWRHSVDISAK